MHAPSNQDRIRNLYQRIDFSLKKGNYKIQIKDSFKKVLSEALFEIENTNPKYIYLKEIVITDQPLILI